MAINVPGTVGVILHLSHSRIISDQTIEFNHKTQTILKRFSRHFDSLQLQQHNLILITIQFNSIHNIPPFSLEQNK